jgi:hypothetical protein
MYYNTDTQICLGLAALVSTSCEVFLLISHMSAPKLMKHPGCYIFGQCFARIMIDLHCFTILDFIRDFTLEIGICRPIGWISLCCYLVCWNYMTFLGLEIMLKVINPSSMKYKTRAYTFHCGSWALPAITAILMYEFCEMKLQEGICFIEFDRKGE